MEESYQLPEERRLTKRDLNKAYLYWISLSQATYSWERMMGPAMAGTMIPIMERIYPSNEEFKEERKEMMKRHMQFYNTEAWLTGPPVLSVIISMEEEKAAGVPIKHEDVSGMKTGLMGPMAGVGDTLRQATLIPIIGSIAISLGTEGNFLGPIFYMLATLILNYGFSYFSFHWMYKKGKEGINEIFASGALEKFMTMATAVGAVTIGGLAANTVNVTSSLTLNFGENQIVIQEILDTIIQGILPLGAVFLTLYLLVNKNWGSTKILLILIAIAIIGVLIGFL
ncbi:MULTISPECIES: PTS system mannose/fructose/sorbose family transporter subunit IID [Tetragenococcus]|uniref:PTS system mannose-specific IID component n=2 Tax=Tetragenococcus TaxID=51668 RepID=A0A091CEN6_9ENTE|nr:MULTISPECIES: PTS system mannose/fructose/sorbose family transporter subunit IID [Tetragenococcus]GMA47483.1 PTS N-acetylglucosamine transporter subunit IIABC [Tetragenococcus muriaticus]GMA54076.1 PTS N-acetylglucosamine transporter subunit IIABC [Alicyclobacillus contaminans]AYW48276.1 PTS sugar transporter subunit IID [Tetragenococcus osmophilus]KFN93118.1 PTS system mannose-specific IID component [Tetragenococcus muriaticus 3MR10-3]GMA72034.1 PTS N-acetylglucosamine transporter subunit 